MLQVSKSRGMIKTIQDIEDLDSSSRVKRDSFGLMPKDANKLVIGVRGWSFLTQ